ncbi:MAG: exonuclease domain-containing protein [Bdellovibrio sp.]
MSASTLDFQHCWRDQTFVAFDLETTGAYPLTSEIVELGAVKWAGGKLIDELQFMVRPQKAMSDFIIGIHGISNEMVADKKRIAEELPRFREFIQGSILLAHHAAFDMGFLAVELEAEVLPTVKALCTSRLGRALIRGTPNHKLQTLVRHFGIDPGRVHRAADDARSCLEVALRIFTQLGEVSVQEIARQMQGFYEWKDFSIQQAPPLQKILSQAIHEESDVEFVYLGGSLKGKLRRATPLGLVRSPEGDWMPAICHIDRAEKRFYFDKIAELRQVFR